MVVSAILTTALAPITGALFGASYGTAIRIGYEIIFPALFGKVKANPDAQDVIKSLHTMFQATGGASAMEFGIDQGIEMAKKKTESPSIQHLINTDLGITEEQLQRRHIINDPEARAEQKRIQELVETYMNPDPEAPGTEAFFEDVDFLIRNFSANQISKWMRDINDGVSTHPPRNQAMIISAWNQLFNKEKEKKSPPIIDPPDKQDAERKLWESRFITFQQAWMKVLDIWHQLKTTGLRVVTGTTAERTNAIVYNQNFTAQLNIAKNTVLDVYKKMTNFLVDSKNTPHTRVFATQMERILPPAFG